MIEPNFVTPLTTNAGPYWRWHDEAIYRGIIAVLDDQIDALITQTCQVAASTGIPCFPLVALIYAESRYNPRAARWRTRAYTTKAEIAAERGPDLAAIYEILRLIHAVPSHDISFGLGQQAWHYSVEYAQQYGQHHDGCLEPGSVLAFRHSYFDPEHALMRAADLLARLLRRPDVAGDPFLALCRYNKPNGIPTPEAQQNYRNALEWAVARLSPPEEPTPEPTPEPAPPAESEHILDRALEDLWNAGDSGALFDRGLGICNYWCDHFGSMGSPVGTEHVEDGTVFQAFAHGILEWRGDGAHWHAGQ